MPPADASREDLQKAMSRTTAWAHRCKHAHNRPDQALFGIIQGGTDQELRHEHAEAIKEIDFDGFAIGGLSVGESHEDLVATTRFTAALMPENKPRYLMGVGTPLICAKRLLPESTCLTASCRHETPDKRLRSRAKANSTCGTVDSVTTYDLWTPSANAYAAQNTSRSYLRHLIVSKEILASTLLTIHNLTFYQDLMRSLRNAITEGTLGKVVEHHRTLAAKNKETKEAKLK